MAWGSLNGPPQLDRHHIIPYARLRAVWNAIVAVALQTQRPEATPAFRHWIALCGMPLAAIDRHLARLRTNAIPAGERDGIVTTIRVHAAWPPWNTVIGPHNRVLADDPRDVYFDRYRVGLTPPELRRMEALETFYHRIENLPLQGLVSPSTLRSIADAASQARPAMLGCTLPIPYRGAAMWEDTGGGHYRKRRA